MNVKTLKFLLFFLVFDFVLWFSSCTIPKRTVYFQKKHTKVADSINNNKYTPLLQPSDLLSITVSGIDPEAVVPFNTHPTIESSANAYIMGSYSIGSPYLWGYVIDADSTISFPILGKIKLGGLDKNDATNLMVSKLQTYVNNPTVNIRILNYKITVLGDVRNPGTFMIANERITLPQAIGLAGDLNITGIRHNIVIIRYINGKRTETRIDLTTDEIFNSSVYNLRQNDLVYVEPNRAKINSSLFNAPNVGIAISVISLILTMANIIIIKR
jgi:polysaccharide export outer membrane protein